MNEQNTVAVWDISIRVFHWALVIGFAVAYLTGEIEGDLHAYPGYFVLGLLAYRLVWGLIGTRYARFSSFLFGPGEVLAYLKDLLSGRSKRYLGHNPAGSVMIYLLLFSLFATVMSGLEAYAQEGKGPLANNSIAMIEQARANGDDEDDDEEHEGDEFWEEIHEFFSHLTLLLIGLHIIGVLVASAINRENLVQSMITGRKRSHPD